MSVKHEQLLYWLAIYRAPGFGPRRFAHLCQHFTHLADAFIGTKPTAELSNWCRQHQIADFRPDWASVEKDLNWAQQKGCAIITWDEPSYPERLRQIPSPPPILFVQGQLEVLNSPQLAMVGSRRPSAQGKDTAERFAYELALAGLTITSGLALGIDTASHQGALKACGKTIAVLGSSLDNIYPYQNRSLSSKIAENGAVISEFPLRTLPKAEHFPRRNRIISGLSYGVLVVESALKSGSLITASYAVDHGRDVFAIPGSIQNPLAKGCHELIRQGAKCVESVTHVLEELSQEARTGLAAVAKPVGSFLPLAIFDLSKEKASSLTQKLLAHIGEICTTIDLMVDKTGLTAAEVSSMLLELELMGVVTSVPGGYVRVATGGQQ